VTAFETNFSALDWGIVGVYLAGSVVIGLLANRYVRNMTDYVVAGRSLRSHLAIATMIGTELGLVTVMYSGQVGFTSGFAAFHIPVSACVVTMMVGLSGFIVVPLRRMKVMTIPEFYEKRFGRGVRILGGLTLAVAGILNMGLFLKMGSMFVVGITGMQMGLELKLVMTALLALVLFYTVLGGMVSVVITDYIQFVVLSVGLLAACGIAVGELGWDRIVEGLHQLKGDAGFDPFHAEGQGTTYIVWMVFLGLVGSAIWPTAVMRACAAADEKVVRRLYIWSSFGFLVRFMVPYFLAICALVYFAGNEKFAPTFVPEVGAPAPEATLMALPVFLGQVLPTGIIGIVTAGMLAAFMSTHDSYLLCWSSVLTEDVVAAARGGALSTRVRLLVARTFILLIGLFLLFWGLWYPMKNQAIWSYMAISGAIYFNGAFALLALGIYWKRASRVGAYAGLICGSCAIVGLEPLWPRLGLDVLAERHGAAALSASIGLCSVAAAVVMMIAASLIFPDRRHSDATPAR
jgi:SSS family solute:Na+ symporter